MKIINTSERIYDFGLFKVLPGRRGTAVPEGLDEKQLAKIVATVKSFAPELEFDEPVPAKPDARDEEIARLRAELAAKAETPKVEPAKPAKK